MEEYMMNYLQQLKRNVFKNYVFTFLNSFNVTRGIWMLYLAFRGLSLIEIGLMESVYHITSFTMEIPTGMVADIFGRKMSRVLGRLCFIISTCAMLLGFNSIIFGISFALSAIGNNLESGAGDALIYDSLKELKEENAYMRIKGKEEIFFQFASSTAMIIGGFLGTINYTYVYLVALAFAIVTFIQSLTFTEPIIEKNHHHSSKLKMFTNQFVTSIRIIRNDFRIAFLIIAVEVCSTFITTVFFYGQNYMKSTGRNELQIGIILAIGGFVAALMATYTYKIEKRIGFKGLFILLPLSLLICFWGFTLKGYTEIFLILILAIDSIFFVSTSDYINRLIPSEQRATILSFQSMVFSLFMIILFPIIGKLGDLYGLLHAFRIVATIATFVLIAIMCFILCSKKVVVNDTDKNY